MGALLMLIKSRLLLQDPDERAFLLVGAYIGHFALLEMGINNAIQEVLSLNTAGAMIVTRNMSFGDKIKTLRSLVDHLVLDRNEAVQFDSLARQARAISEDRNMIAHTPFYGSHHSDGVTFFKTTANSSLKFEETDWSIDEFVTKIDHIRETDNGLRRIEKRMSLQRVAEALVKTDEQNVGGLLALGDKLFPEHNDKTPQPD